MRSPMFYKPNIFRRILLVAGITILALALIILANYMAKIYFNREVKVPVTDQPVVVSLNFELDPGINYKRAVSNHALFFYSAENLKIVNQNGELTEDLSLKMTRPSVALKGDYALFFDLGGRNVVTFNKTKQMTTLTLEENIMLAAVNESGYALIVTEGSQHKCAVRVYTPDGEEIFKWNSGNLSVVGADIASNSKDITVSAVNTDEGMIKTHIIMFNIAKEKPFTNDLYEGSLYSIIRYSGGYLYCIGSSETRIYNGYGKCIGVADYSSRELLHYKLSEDLLVLAFSGSANTPGAVAEIKSFNHKGEETGSFSCAQKFDFFDVKDSHIVLNNGRTLSVLNNRCKEKRQLNLSVHLRDFVFFGSPNKGIGITATGAELIYLN